MDGLISKRQPLPHPVFKIKMGGNDVTAVLTPFLESVTYTDYQEGEADTIDIVVDDTDGRFRGPWYPKEGQTLELEFGYAGQPLCKPNVFEIDEIECQGPPDTVTIKAIATGVKHAYRTHQGKAYDNTTLAAIAQKVARRLKLELVGKIEPIQITRVTQIHENDLTFMNRLAGEYGYAFSIKGSKMVFCKRADLQGSKPALTFKRTDLTRYHIRDKIMLVAKTAQVSYHDTKTKRLNHYKVQDTSRATSEYEIKVNVRAESETQAKVKAEAALERENENATQLEITVFGNPKLVAGINFELADMGKLGGIYHVVKSRHCAVNAPGGYTTEGEAKRVPQEQVNGR